MAVCSCAHGALLFPRSLPRRSRLVAISDDRCLGVFPPTDEILAAQKRTRETKRQIAEAVSREDYAAAANLKGELDALLAADPVFRLQTQLAAALKNERYE